MFEEDQYTHIYTTAPYPLDLPETVVLNYNAGSTATGRRVRLVAVPSDEASRQAAQYVVNLESALSAHEWKFELQFGNVREPEEFGGAAVV